MCPEETKDLESKATQSLEPIDLLTNVHFYIITLLMTFMTITYYGDEITGLSWSVGSRDFFSSSYLHDLHRSLFLIPMMYTAVIFRLRGAIVITLIIVVIFIPRAAFMSPNPDAMLRTLIFGGVAGLATILLGTERDRKHDLLIEMGHRSEAEAALGEHQEDLSLLMSNLPGMVYRYIDDKDRTIVFASEGCFPLLGYSSEDLVEKKKITLAQLIHPEDRRYVLEEVETARKGNKPFQILYRILTSSGEEKWIWEQGRKSSYEKGELPVVEGFLIDVTQRKEADEALAHLGAIVEFSEDAIISQSLEGIVRTWNTGAERMYGYTASEVLGRHISFFIPPDRAHEVQDILERVKRGGRVSHYETVGIRKDCSHLHVSLAVSLIRDKDGVGIGISTIIRDITEHKQAEIALAESETRYRELFENASEGICVRDLEGRILMANQAMAELTGYAIEELSQMNMSGIFSPSSYETIMKRQMIGVERGVLPGSEIHEYQMIRKDGSERIVEVVTGLLDSAGVNPTVQAIVRDVTGQRQAQENIRRYTNLATQAQEKERQRIALELHDDTLQSLATLGLRIDRLIGTQRKLPEEITESLQQLRGVTDDLLRNLRRFCQDLRPPMIEDLGLVEALQWMAEGLSNQTGIDIHIHTEGLRRRLSSQTELLLFRIAQEALNNARKHSKATEVKLRVTFGPKQVGLTIEDNGQGFEVPLRLGDFAQLGGLGLMGMHERAILAGGTFDVSSNPNTGTVVTVLIPE